MFSNTPNASTRRTRNTFLSSSSSSNMSGNTGSIRDSHSTGHDRMRRVTNASAHSRDPHAIPLDRTRDEDYISTRVAREIQSPPLEVENDLTPNHGVGGFQRYRGTPALHHLERDAKQYTETPVGMYKCHVNHGDKLEQLANLVFRSLTSSVHWGWIWPKNHHNNCSSPRPWSA